MLSSRERILEAAARVYAQHGFRGATTRRIADEAGVNEITVFRQFGSKEALIGEAIRACASGAGLLELPLIPSDPERELTRWAESHLANLRGRCALIRKTMSELEERPEVVPCASAAPIAAKERLCEYVARLREHGFVAADGTTARQREWDAAAVTMLMSALFSDAMGRDVMPDMYPVSAERAPAMYVRIFLRAVGVVGPRADADDVPAPGARSRRAPAGRGRPQPPSSISGSTPNVKR
jgi:AcrR family transcriptional regulator